MQRLVPHAARLRGTERGRGCKGSGRRPRCSNGAKDPGTARALRGCCCRPPPPGAMPSSTRQSGSSDPFSGRAQEWMDAEGGVNSSTGTRLRTKSHRRGRGHWLRFKLRRVGAFAIWLRPGAGIRKGSPEGRGCPAPRYRGALLRRELRLDVSRQQRACHCAKAGRRRRLSAPGGLERQGGGPSLPVPIHPRMRMASPTPYQPPPRELPPAAAEPRLGRPPRRLGRGGAPAPRAQPPRRSAALWLARPSLFFCVDAP